MRGVRQKIVLQFAEDITAFFLISFNTAKHLPRYVFSVCCLFNSTETEFDLIFDFLISFWDGCFSSLDELA